MSRTKDIQQPSMISRTIHEHASKFQLIADQGSWLQRYDSWREGDSNPAYDRMDKANAILQATFETLAEAKQLRLKRFVGYTGLTYERKYYHEIQVLDQNGQVATTLVGSIPEADMPDAEQYIKSTLNTLVYRDEHNNYTEHPNVVQVTIVLPIEFPNHPEFRDEEGNPIDCGYELHSHSYYPISIVLDKEFITDEFVTEEMRQEKIRKCAMEQCKKFKEDLMINRWHPNRVEYLLNLGYEIDDM